MNNKGFTLIELIITIALLAIVSTLVIVSVGKISDNIKKANRENIIKRIEVAAAKYAFDTKKTKVLVDDLIKQGYYNLNNEDGILLDPTDETIKLNCYYVNMNTTNGNYYTATFSSEKSTTGICSS